MTTPAPVDGDPSSLLPPRPAGWLNPRTSAFARTLASVVGAGNRMLDRTPGARAFYRRQLRRTLEFRDVDVPVRAGRGGSGVDGFRIVFLSDLHAGSYLAASDFAWIFREVAAREPDLIVFGGDLINTGGEQIEAVLSALPELGARGLERAFAVPGNHERYWADLDAIAADLTRCGVRLLVNEGVRVSGSRGGSVWLAGVDEWGEGDPELEAAFAGRDPDEPTVLASHHPDLFGAACASLSGGLDLQLSGHTHGGQVRLFGWAPMRHSAMGYLAGRYERTDGVLYVGRGIGATILPLRVGAPPEVPVVTLRSR